jgi:hypothetical protein
VCSGSERDDRPSVGCRTKGQSTPINVERGSEVSIDVLSASLQQCLSGSILLLIPNLSGEMFDEGVTP